MKRSAGAQYFSSTGQGQYFKFFFFPLKVFKTGTYYLIYILNLAALWRMDERIEKGAEEEIGGQLVGCNTSKS